jgi:hypothetical protein
VCYGIVAISAQVQLQEDIPAEGRGRVFGVLNMLISVASILPIIVVGQIADIVGTTPVIVTVAALVLLSGIVSIVVRGPVKADEGKDLIRDVPTGTQLDPTGSSLPMHRREPHHHAQDREGAPAAGAELDDHRDGDVGL